MIWFRTVFGLAVVLMISACATPGTTWSPVEENTRNTQVGRYSVALPSGWMRLGSSNADRVLVSRDGANLQAIEVAYTKPEEAFPNLKKGVAAASLPSELAELQLAELQAGPATANLTVVRNEPLALAGLPGYLLHVSFKNARGLRYERVIAGFAESSGYYTVSYSAPTIYYFGRDRTEFDGVVRSLKNVPK